MQDKELRFITKCVRCGKAKNQHRAFTLECPKGKRTPIGYRRHGPETFAANVYSASLPNQDRTERK